MTQPCNFELLMRFPVEGFSFNPENKSGMQVSSGDGRRTFSIIPKHPEDDGFGHRLGVEARITCSVSCDADQYDLIAKFIDGELIPRKGASKPPLFSNGNLSVDGNGNRVHGSPFWFEWFSPDIQCLVNEAIDEAWADFDRIVRIWRWEQKSSFRISSRSLAAAPYWRTTNDGLFYAVPQKSSTTLARPDRETGWFGWIEKDKVSFFRLWNDLSIDEPLGHELQNEAEVLIERAPRSALLMAAAAVEAGVKDHIRRVAPITDWLIREMPSPPVGKLLKSYLPELHRENPRVETWNRATTLFNKFQNVVIPERNKLSHVGKSVKADDARIYVMYARDILYMIDYLDGHDWALGNLSAETIKLIDVAMPPQHRQEIQITLHAGPGDHHGGVYEGAQ